MLMTMSEETSDCGELLGQLRRSIRKSRRLADQLASDPEVGQEARHLLARLQQVAAELDCLEMIRPELRSLENDPIWGGTLRLRF